MNSKCIIVLIVAVAVTGLATYLWCKQNLGPKYHVKKGKGLVSDAISSKRFANPSNSVSFFSSSPGAVTEIILTIDNGGVTQDHSVPVNPNGPTFASYPEAGHIKTVVLKQGSVEVARYNNFEPDPNGFWNDAEMGYPDAPPPSPINGWYVVWSPHSQFVVIMDDPTLSHMWTDL